MTTMERALGAAAARRVLSTIGALALGLVCGCGAPGEVAAVQQSALTHRDRDNPNPALFENDARPFGASIETWSERWWHWSYAIPASLNPSDTLTADCGQSQHGPVFYLPAAPGGVKVLNRSCTIRGEKGVALLLSSILNDFPCPDPTFKPAPGQTLFDFLSTGARQLNDDVATIDVTLDGRALTKLLAYRVASDDLINITGDVSLQQFDNCITGSSQPAAVDSYFVIFKPLTPGAHVITTRVVNKAGHVFARTYDLTVLGDDQP